MFVNVGAKSSSMLWASFSLSSTEACTLIEAANFFCEKQEQKRLSSLRMVFGTRQERRMAASQAGHVCVLGESCLAGIGGAKRTRQT